MSAPEINLPNTDETLIWTKSSHSGVNGNCVEVAFPAGGGVSVRDSKARGRGATLSFSGDQWAAFLDGIEAGEMRAEQHQ